MEKRTYGDIFATLDRDQKKAVAEMTQRIVNDVIDTIGDDIVRRIMTDDFESPANVHFDEVVPRVMKKLCDEEFDDIAEYTDVNYVQYCPRCQHAWLNEDEEPCRSCCEMTRSDSEVPVHFVEKEESENDRF